MVDVVLFARVNHAPAKLENGFLEIPIKVIAQKAHFLNSQHPNAPAEVLDYLKKRTLEATEIQFPAREGAILRGDSLLIEGIYDPNSKGYALQRIHTGGSLGGDFQGFFVIGSTFRNPDSENESHSYVPADNRLYRGMGIWTPF